MSTSSSPIRIGAMAPLTPPGWVEAGRQLLAGLELGVRDVNAAGGVAGRPLELLVRDTAADPQRAVAAVEELVSMGVAALAGEYHSIVARAVAARADALELPFLCASAVLDQLTDNPTRWVARIAPPQSRGWHAYADFLTVAGHKRVALALASGGYWEAGAKILRRHLTAQGDTVIDLDAQLLDTQGICDELARTRATALLLLVGYPQPAVSIVRAVRRDRRHSDVLIGAPAGQPELADWITSLPEDGAGIPFLRYMPDRLGSLGRQVVRGLSKVFDRYPSFVALEGYDTISVLAEVMRSHGIGRSEIVEAWGRVEVQGTRGPISLSRNSTTGIWQWPSPPIQVVDRDPEDHDRFRTLLSRP